MSKQHKASIKKVTGKRYETTVRDFGRRLRLAMNGESNNMLAKRCDMSERVIRNYLLGITYPSIERLALLAEATDKTLSWFVSENNSDNNAMSTSDSDTLNSPYKGSVQDLSMEYQINNSDGASPAQRLAWLMLLDAMTLEERVQVLRYIQRHGITTLIPNEREEKVRDLVQLLLDLDDDAQRDVMTLIESKKRTITKTE